MKIACVLCVVLSLLSCAFGRMYTKCELAQKMHSIGYELESLPDWMCLMYSESAFNSTAVGGPNTNGSFDWGIFQINDGYWCTVEGVGNDCNISCFDLIDDDLDDDLACVEIIFARHGFTAWNAWKAKCQDGLDGFDVDECF